MPTDEALALAGALLANYPGSVFTALSQAAVADTLERCGMDIAAALVDRARFEFTKPPSAAQLHELAREIRFEADEAEHVPIAALPAGEILAEMPPDVRERVKRMQASWADEDERTQAERDEEWQRKKDAMLRGPLMRKGPASEGGKICDGTNEVPVKRGGKFYCPGCDVEVPDIIIRRAAKEAAS
jgi:hypothetical protein